MNPGLILAIFGWIFILGGAVAYGYFLRQVIKKQETIELKELIKNGIIILGSSIVVVLGLTFLAAGYLNDNATIEYLGENSIVFEPISGVMTYIGIIVFGLFSLLNRFFQKSVRVLHSCMGFVPLFTSLKDIFQCSTISIIKFF